jgi:hypothetical protein
MEYTYPSLEAAEQDMAHWAVPAMGIKVFKSGQPIRSSFINSPVAAGDCSTDWRQSFDSRDLALDFLADSELSPDEVEAYYCDCKKWHVRPIKGV